MSRGANLAPVWNKWQGFKAGALNNQTISSSSFDNFVLLNFDNSSGGTRFNIGGAYNPGTKLYTVPEDGVYLISASAGISSAPGGIYRISVRTPSGTGAYASTTMHVVGEYIGLSHIISASTTSYLEAGTVLGAYMSDTNADSYVVNNGVPTFFSIIKIH
jgi:hypothetical protein